MLPWLHYCKNDVVRISQTNSQVPDEDRIVYVYNTWEGKQRGLFADDVFTLQPVVRTIYLGV